jgi:predicted Zn-dependent peptidase
MKALQTKKIDKPSLERALNQELLNLYSEIADNSSLATMLGESLMLSGNYLRNFEIIEGYKKLTAEQLQAVAKKYLNSNQRSVAIINPEAKKAVKKKGKS